MAVKTTCEESGMCEYPPRDVALTIKFEKAVTKQTVNAKTERI